MWINQSLAVINNRKLTKHDFDDTYVLVNEAICSTKICYYKQSFCSDMA